MLNKKKKKILQKKFNLLSTNPIEWSNTLKQFVDILPILWGWRLKS